MMTTKAMHVRLDESVLTQLKAVAAEEDRSVAFMAARAISRWLADRENAKANPEPIASAAPAAVLPWQPPPAPFIIGPMRRRDWMLRALRTALVEHGTDVPDSRGRTVDISKLRKTFDALYPGDDSATKTA